MLEKTVVEDAIDALGDVLEWRLTAARWEFISGILGRMTAAATQPHGVALREATVELELASPWRINRFGDEVKGPPPKPVRDRVNQLVHTLGEEPPTRDPKGTANPPQDPQHPGQG